MAGRWAAPDRIRRRNCPEKDTGYGMNGFKKLGWLTITLILCISLSLWFLHVFGFRSPLFALLLNWMAMTWVVLVGQAVDFGLPIHYYHVHSFERTGRVYERLGIRWFQRLVRREPLARLSPTLRLSDNRTLSAFRQLDCEMRKAETSHVYIFLLMIVVIGYALLRQWFDAVGWMLACNIIINGYPIMLQRYNRIRLQALMQRQAA
jgi:hypothetical protein